MGARRVCRGLAWASIRTDAGAPVFNSADEIREVVDLLERREASIWHACQLRDLQSYLKIGGVPSRQRLEQGRLGFTPFVSDPAARANGLWDKVLFSLGDLGRPFAWGMRATPAPRGPIMLQLAPRALAEAHDLALCLRPRGARGFDRAAASLLSAGDVDQLYVFPVEAGFPLTTFVRHGDSLRSAFAFAKGARRPEFSCSVRAGVVGFESLVAVWVDPIDLGGSSLLEKVRATVASAGLSVPVRERSMTSERRTVLAEIVTELRDGPVPLRLLAGRHGVSTLTRTWVDGVRELELDWLWDRYAMYLIEGTLGLISSRPVRSKYVERPRPSAPRLTPLAQILNGLKEQ